MEPDFTGYATKNGIKCADGRTIMQGAFKHNHGTKVPLVWQHQHNSPENVLGHALLQNRDDGVYAYAFFNSTTKADEARELVVHGDVDSLSIYANDLSQQGDNVVHGNIREVSLVLSGANPGARIDNVNLYHGDTMEILDEEAVIYTGLELQHSGYMQHEDSDDSDDSDDSGSDSEGKTVKDVYDAFSQEQKNVVHYLIGEALESDGDDDSDDEDDSDDSNDDVEHSAMKGTSMTRNVFDQTDKDKKGTATLTHDQMTAIVEDAKRIGSFKEAFLSHAQQYGITNIEELFPDAKNVDPTPEWIKRDTGWVSGVINGAKATPFSRIKSRSADVTHEEARALGYIKGNLKKEEFFSVKSRVTTPKTIYKKQKLDRDDIIDITDMDVVAWLKAEMRMMLEEEVARAILIGDGREVEDEDKISEENIRPIATDHEFYTHPVTVRSNIDAKDLVKAVVRARKHYKGEGNPTFFTTEDVLADLLLAEDKMGRRLYETEAALASALRVSKIEPVEVMESMPTLLGVMVNMRDYTVGADRGGKTSMFDDFDIDYNQYKYLIETRMSGALTKHKTAIAIWRSEGTEVTPTTPTRSGNTITIPAIDGIAYTIDGVDVTGETYELNQDEYVVVEANAEDGYYFTANVPTSWSFNYETQD